MLRRAFLLGWIFLLGAMITGVVGRAEEAPAPQAVRMTPPPPKVTGESAKVAMTMSAGLPIIVASVNGQGPFKFAVDTGAGGQLHISAELASKLALVKIGEARASDGSGKNPQTVSLFAIDRFAIGNVTFSGVVSAATSPGGRPYDGVIGMGLVREFLLTIDYAGNSVGLDKSELPPADGKQVLDYRPGPVIVVPVKIGGVEIPTHLDTGNSRFPLIVAAELIAGLPTQGTPRAIGQARTVSNVVDMFSVGLAAPVRIGDVTLAITEVGYPTVAPGGNLGSLGLTGLILRVDQKNHRVALAAP